MQKAVVFGVGRNYEKYKNFLFQNYEIVGFIDNAWEKINECDSGMKVYPLGHINEMIFDKVIITPVVCYEEIFNQLLNVPVSQDKIIILSLLPELYQHYIFGNRYYGQHCDDLVISAIFARLNIDKPSYLDLGCNHPYASSNTALLYENGCRGINVDANPLFVKMFNRCRPDDVNLNMGIGKEKGKKEFYMFDESSALNTFSYEWAETLNMPIKERKSVYVESLNDIVSKYCINGFPDFLDCDIEGNDYSVLSNYDFTHGAPKVICVEVKEGELLKYDEMMKSKSYIKFCRIGENNIYIREEYYYKVSYYDK